MQGGRLTPLESSIERAFVTALRKKLPNALVRKMNGLGYAAWPDRMVLHEGRTVFIEFKRPGCKPTELQAHLHAHLCKSGFDVVVATASPRAVDVVLEMLKLGPPSRPGRLVSC